MEETTPVPRTPEEQDIVKLASAKLLLRMKQTYRDKDIADRAFLQKKLLGNG